MEYQIDADPGGWLPKWLVRIISKSIPLRTLRKLRSRVAITSRDGRYRDYIESISHLVKRHGGDALLSNNGDTVKAESKDPNSPTQADTQAVAAPPATAPKPAPIVPTPEPAAAPEAVLTASD
jgi:hypothetical protein